MTVNLEKGSPSVEVPGGAGRKARSFPNLALLVPLVLVNAAAIWGQAGWAQSNFAGGSWLLAILFACAVESIGVYLALEAHSALLADQAAGLLRLGSYAVGALAGLLNYWHFQHNKPQAIAFALMSMISPWLWAIRSRSLNRSRLSALGLVDPRGVKLSTNRKFWHPWKALQVIRWASWQGETNPEAAVWGWELRDQLEASTPAPPEPDHDPEPTKEIDPTPEPKIEPTVLVSVLDQSARTPEEIVRAADTLARRYPDLTKKEIAQKIGVSDSYLRRCRRELVEHAA